MSSTPSPYPDESDGYWMHYHDENSQKLADAIIKYAVERVRMDPPPLDAPKSLSELQHEVGNTITAEGLGAAKALSIFTEQLAPSCISVDHPLFLSFVPGAPTESSVLFDLVVAASNVYAGSWLEGAGAVYAENQALAWLADLAGLPSSAGGVFVSGGTAGNLSALIAARWQWRQRGRGAHARVRPIILASGGAHSSVALAANAMDADLVAVPTDYANRLMASDVRAVYDAMSVEDRVRVCAVVATAGTTNLGVIDDLAGIGAFAREKNVWFHVDGAYGAAALCARSVRHEFAGIELADSFIVDPHKWLFGPYDCCALLYRDVRIGKAAHTQKAEYLDVLIQDATAQLDEAYNPADLAHHLTRRARGLPFWFSLATHGTEAYEEAMEITLQVTRDAADMVRASEHLEFVVPPSLSILVVRRKGWSPDDYKRWSDRMLHDGIAFVMPTTHQGETVLRMCLVNPRTDPAQMQMLFDSMRS
ncbi:MAG: pyridoxal phosphate-dependent decarboxylase family protein [Ilumatobacteraceae bacterium]